MKNSKIVTLTLGLVLSACPPASSTISSSDINSENEFDRKLSERTKLTLDRFASDLGTTLEGWTCRRRDYMFCTVRLGTGNVIPVNCDIDASQKYSSCYMVVR